MTPPQILPLSTAHYPLTTEKVSIIPHYSIDTAVGFPGVDDVCIGAGGEIVRLVGAEQVAVRVEVQYAGEGHAPGGGDAVLDGCAGAA